MKMSGEQYRVKKIRIRTLDERDKKAYWTFPNNVTNFKETFCEKSGYNQSSPEGNKQQCKVCGKGGPECIGHPLVLDLSSMGRHYLNEFAIGHLTAISNCVCRACKKFVRESNGKFCTLKELSKLPISKKKCDCSQPTIVEFKEEKSGEKRQKYQKKNTDPKKFTAEIEELYDLIKSDELVFPKELKVQKETVLGFFYDKIVMIPTAEHQISFMGSTGPSEHTGMMKLYESIYQSVTKFGNADAPELKKKLVSLFIGDSDNNYTGTASYLSKADGKEGIFRGDGLNKRAFGTGRAVITLGTRRACEIQIPEYIQKNLQYEIVIMSYNIAKMQKKVGLAVTHLVTDMQSSSLNRRKVFVKLTPTYKLKIGDRVLKHIEDGDSVNFSRQPTLWRHSELGYTAFVWKNKCIGVPEPNVSGHNADFDGDEGNITIGIDLYSRIENELILSRFNIMGAHCGEPVIAITYNGKVGAYVASTDDNIEEHLFEYLISVIEGKMIDENNSEAGNYIADVKIDREYYKRMAQKFGLNYHSGRILISMLLPRCLEYTRDDVIIKQGIMLAGKLKGVDVAGKLISAISNVSPWRGDYFFIDRGYSLFSEYISAKGITISSEDYVMPGELNKQVKAPDMDEQYAELERQVKELEEMKIGQTKAYINSIEEKIVMLIGNFEKRCTEVLEKSEYAERDISIVSFKSGARGNVGNIMTAVVMVGQQYDQSDRLGGNNERLSPYISPDEISLESRGFIKNSYSNGLTASELCVIAGPSRRSTFMVYSGTPESGNASRQTVRNLNGLYVDGTLALVDRNKRIVDPLYGCGCDPARIKNRDVKGFVVNSPLDVLHSMQILRNINN